MLSLALSSPDAVVASLPYLLGFPPRESVVVLWLADRELLMTQRLDLPADERDLPAWLELMWSHAAAREADAILVLLVSDACDITPVHAAIAGSAGERGIAIVDAIAVTDERWRSLRGCGGECCARAGRPVDGEVASLIAAEFTAAGRAPVADRATLVESLAPDETARGRVDALIAPRPDDVETWRDEAIASIVGLVRGSRGVVHAEVAAVVIDGLEDVRVRDTVLWEIGGASTTTRHGALEALSACVRMAPPLRAAPVATCAALTAWLVGDGARAQVALDRALAERPDYALALLLRRSLDIGLPPSTWLEAVAGLSRSICRHGPAVGDT